MRPSWHLEALRGRERELREAAERRRLEEARHTDGPTGGPTSSPRRLAPR